MPPIKTKYTFHIQGHLTECLKNFASTMVVGEPIAFEGPMLGPVANSFYPGMKSTDNITRGIAKVCGIPVGKLQSDRYLGINYKVGEKEFTSDGHCEDNFLIYWDALWNSRVMKELVLARAENSGSANATIYATLKITKSPCKNCTAKLEKFLETDWKLPEEAGGAKIPVKLRLKSLGLYEAQDDESGGHKERHLSDLLKLQNKGALVQYWTSSDQITDKRFTNKGYIHEFNKLALENAFIQQQSCTGSDDDFVRLDSSARTDSINEVKTTLTKKRTRNNKFTQERVLVGNKVRKIKEVKESDAPPKQIKMTSNEDYKAHAWERSVKTDQQMPFGGKGKDIHSLAKEYKSLSDADLNERLIEAFSEI